MPAERYYAVDRIEGTRAILVDDAGETLTLKVRQLPPSTAEGAVLSVPLSADGQPAWLAARVDHAETARRRAEASARIDRLKQRDPGGDVTL